MPLNSEKASNLSNAVISALETARELLRDLESGNGTTAEVLGAKVLVERLSSDLQLSTVLAEAVCLRALADKGLCYAVRS